MAEGFSPLTPFTSANTLAAFRRRIPVDTPAIGTLGARIAALLTIAILANSRPDLREKLRRFRASSPRKWPGIRWHKGRCWRQAIRVEVAIVGPYVNEPVSHGW